MIKTKNIVMITAIALSIASPTIGHALNPESDDSSVKPVSAEEKFIRAKERVRDAESKTAEYQKTISSTDTVIREKLKSHIATYISENYSRCEATEEPSIISRFILRGVSTRSDVLLTNYKLLKEGIFTCIFSGYTKGFGADLLDRYKTNIEDEIGSQVSTRVESELALVIKEKRFKNLIGEKEVEEAITEAQEAEAEAKRLAKQVQKLNNLCTELKRNDDYTSLKERGMSYKEPFASTDADDCSSKNATGS